MASTMSDDERRAFLSHGTRTATVATTRKDGRPHVAPVWFVLDGDDVIFMTGEGTVKGRSLLRTGRAAVSVDDAAPPYSFVTVGGRAEISREPDDMLKWSIRIAARYMGEDQAEDFGRRNAVPTELLVRLHADDVVAIKDLTD